MCISPNVLANGTQVACHKCWQCRENAINDWVGRNIAESKTSKACHAVTLTYGRNRAHDADHERANVLTYSDVQKYLKLLRRHGYPVRYFVTGEFGSKKGRAHWHIMLYWQDKVPPHELDRNFMHWAVKADGSPVLDKEGKQSLFWPHGWSFWTKPTAHAVRYNCKYIQKDMGDAERQGHLAMSKKPPLGTAYFQQMAERYVKQELAPQSLEYRFPEVTRRKQNGQQEIVPFRLKDRPAEMFLDYYLTRWGALHPGCEVPKSKLIEEFLDETLAERRRLVEWFESLPPAGNLTARQRLQVDDNRARLHDLATRLERDAAFAERLRVLVLEEERRKARPRYWRWNPVAWEENNGEAR